MSAYTRTRDRFCFWIPAYAGMTESVCRIARIAIPMARLRVIQVRFEWHRLPECDVHEPTREIETLTINAEDCPASRHHRYTGLACA